MEENTKKYISSDKSILFDGETYSDNYDDNFVNIIQLISDFDIKDKYEVELNGVIYTDLVPVKVQGIPDEYFNFDNLEYKGYYCACICSELWNDDMPFCIWFVCLDENGYGDIENNKDFKTYTYINHKSTYNRIENVNSDKIEYFHKLKITRIVDDYRKVPPKIF